jgi:hypothetical protein
VDLVTPKFLNVRIREQVIGRQPAGHATSPRSTPRLPGRTSSGCGTRSCTTGTDTVLLGNSCGVNLVQDKMKQVVWSSAMPCAWFGGTADESWPR